MAGPDDEAAADDGGPLGAGAAEPGAAGGAALTGLGWDRPSNRLGVAAGAGAGAGSGAASMPNKSINGAPPLGAAGAGAAPEAAGAGAAAASLSPSAAMTCAGGTHDRISTLQSKPTR